MDEVMDPYYDFDWEAPIDEQYHQQMTKASKLAISLAEFLQLKSAPCDEIRLTNFVFNELQELFKDES